MTSNPAQLGIGDSHCYAKGLTTPPRGRSAPSHQALGLEEPGAGDALVAARGRRVWVSLAWRHRPMLAVLIVAASLRVLGWLAIHPAWWFLGDAIDYVNSALDLKPGEWRPSGYSLILLAPLSYFQQLSLVTASQHLLGLGSAVLLYAMLLRYGLAPWLAALATIPMLFDAYTLATEQMLVSEPLFTALVVAAVAVLLWWGRRPPLASCLLAGALFGLSATTRTTGLVLPLVAAVVLFPSVGWRRLAALLIACALPVGLYVTWFDQTYHRLDLTSSTGVFLYGRASQFAQCGRISFPDPELRRLCPSEPVGQRSETFYDFHPNSPIHVLHHGLPYADAQAGQFAVAAIRSQPGDYAALVWRDLKQYFGLRDSGLVPAIYRFRTDVPMDDGARVAGLRYQGGRNPAPQYRPAVVHGLAQYQRFAVTPGLGYLMALSVAGLGLLLGRDLAGRGLKTATALTAGMAFALLVIPAFVVPGDVRYRLPALPLLGAAVALGCHLLYSSWSLRRTTAL